MLAWWLWLEGGGGSRARPYYLVFTALLSAEGAVLLSTPGGTKSRGGLLTGSQQDS